MIDVYKKRFRRTTLLFGVLLTYILVALVWWFISLEIQNQRLADEKFKVLELRAPMLTTLEIAKERDAIVTLLHRNTTKYTGEGTTFILLILVGAWFFYRSLKRQLLAQVQEQHFMMAITHELKTPIAVAKLNLETMQKYQLDAEKKEKMIRTTLDEIARLNLLTNNILISSQLEGQGNFSNREELDFSLLAKDAIKEFGKRFPDTKVVANIVEEIELIGDPLLLQILLNNLLENANKYSPKGSAIEVGLSIKNNSVILTVADHGEGIPANEKTKIFNRFYRVGNELTRKTKGTGLGLYLCSLIAKTHDGTIEVSDNSPTGTIFSVIFAL